MTEFPERFTELAAVVRERRSNLRVDADREIPEAWLRELCDLAMWAPNHERTNPWRFALFVGDGRARLGKAFEAGLQAQGESDERKLDKARTKYLRAPAMLVVGSSSHDDPVFRAENRDAVAAGIQTILLGATALGLASYWSTGEAARVPEVNEVCGFEPTDDVIGLIYLAWPTQSLPAPPKEPAPLVVIS